MGTRHWVFVVLAVLSCAACGGPEGDPDSGGLDGSVGDTSGLDSGGDGGGDAGRIDDVHAFCDAYYERVCAWNSACRSVGSTTCDFPLAADLLRACEDIDANLAAGIVAYDPAAAAACLLVDISSCVRNFDTPACVAAIRGNVPVGGDCYELVAGRSFNQECVPEAFCSLDVCPGTCVARGEVGAACSGQEPCAASLVCSGSICIERPSEGEACPDYACQAPSVCLEGTCFVQRAENESCAGDPEGSCIYPFACVGGICAATSGPDELCRVAAACPDDYICQSVSGPQRCHALLDDGEACDETAPLCLPGSYCHNLGIEGAPDFRCAAYLADGEDCTIYQCTAPSWCRGGGPGDAPGGTYRPSGGEGDVCTSTVDRAGGGSRCQSGLHCGPDGMCHGLQPSGGACSSSHECVDGLWCDASTTCAPAGALDGSCHPGDSRSCVASAYCDETNCVPLLPDGASCSSSEQCMSQGCDGTTCLPRLVRCLRP